MADWSDFYTLIGSTAATLIGLIFVVISLGADHAKAGDEHPADWRYPTLIHFASLLFGALAMMAPLSDMARALAIGLIGCVGLSYMANLAFLASKRIKAEERQTLWFGILPIVGYAGFLVTAAAWALASSFAPEIGGLACVVLLAAALHNCWTMTLIIISRPD
jgi:peptidoglycan/LPS O-acetylase OafA/YrhL